EARLVSPYPRGRVARHAVLPGSEPEENQLQLIAPPPGEQRVDRGEVEATFFGLDQLPRYGREHGIEVHRPELRPGRSHISGARRRRIAEFAAENEKRLVLDLELDGAAVPDEPWLCGDWRGECEQRERCKEPDHR